ncbi:MAG: hypothetical protein JNK15_03455 [Planctomycetes bacterium]|nr:hypothetical protein [Planctomycetota bacterium]
MEMQMSDSKEDRELAAIRQVISALSDLDPEARSRVVSYAFQRLGISSTTLVANTQPSLISGSEAQIGSQPAQGSRQVDVRTFGQSKNPRSANERVAVVAYYLAELAPQEDRKPLLSAADITKYFKQADFPLPGAARMTLVNAKNAGYIDAAGERGMYRLNPVGHNLVVHGLPASTDAPGSPRRPRARASKTRKKRVKRAGR